jgi:hypothetical protein
MRGAPLSERVDHESFRRCAPFSKDVDDVDARARREGAHQRVHGILTRLRRTVEPRRGSIRPTCVELVFSYPHGANGDRRLRDGVGYDVRVRHAALGNE